MELINFEARNSNRQSTIGNRLTHTPYTAEGQCIQEASATWPGQPVESPRSRPTDPIRCLVSCPNRNRKRTDTEYCAAQLRPRSGSREMKPMRCTHACQCLCAQAFTAMTFYTLQPNFHGKSYFFITFDRKNIFNDFRKFQSFRAQRGAKFFDFRRKSCVFR